MFVNEGTDVILPAKVSAFPSTFHPHLQVVQRQSHHLLPVITEQQQPSVDRESISHPFLPVITEQKQPSVDRESISHPFLPVTTEQQQQKIK